MALFRLIYVSSARQQLSDPELDDILESAVRHNTPQGITGMLLYCDGNFMQVLEGEEAAVDETYGRICRDRRHYDIHLIEKEPIGCRDFPGWAMAFRRLARQEAASHPAYAPLIESRFDPGLVGATPGLATELLKRFCR